MLATLSVVWLLLAAPGAPQSQERADVPVVVAPAQEPVEPATDDDDHGVYLNVIVLEFRGIMRDGRPRFRVLNISEGPMLPADTDERAFDIMRNGFRPGSGVDYFPPHTIQRVTVSTFPR